MAGENSFFPILGYGEKMVGPVDKPSAGGEPDFPRSYFEARDMLLGQISHLKSELARIPIHKKMDEVVITVRLNHKFLAKSYTPNAFFSEAGVENIGSRRWLYASNDSLEPQYSKMHFIKASEKRIGQMSILLGTSEPLLSESFKKDIRKIEKLCLVQPGEVIQGFKEDWSSGRVELVLHPFDEESKAVESKLISILNKHSISNESIQVRRYANGPTFMSCVMDRETLIDIAGFNPLRTVHPLKVTFFPEMRALYRVPLDLFPPPDDKISTIKVGMFDGGVDDSNPFLAGYVIENSVAPVKAVSPYVEHGTAVSGILLYGPLNDYRSGQKLPCPPLQVESFRVLPTSDPKDIDLYEVIDKIEIVVPNRRDIRVYNLSFGPCGPIIEDHITRFTYSLDKLAWDYKKLFVVAVGNDGDLEYPLNRVQAPSDLVNGLGVGAFSYIPPSYEIRRAQYSCIGRGREGCKIKPDVTAFGGDENYPLHVLSTRPDVKSLTMGTSFSTPIISRMAADILGRSDYFTPLVARALLIHSATPVPGIGEEELGYGIINQPVDRIVECCSQKEATILFVGSIQPASYARLPIPFPSSNTVNARICISWTIAVLTETDPYNSDDYTSCAIESTYHPNDQRYSFYMGDKRFIKDVQIHKEEIARLLSEGFKRGGFPVSKSPATVFRTERERRDELKWDTIVKQYSNLNSSSLRNPCLVLHGLGRNNICDPMDYAVVVSITAPRYPGNLYTDILGEFRLLEPIRLRNINEILVPITGKR